MISPKFKKIKLGQQDGQLLLEALVVMAAFSVIAALGAQSIFVSMFSSKNSAEKNAATGLLEETFEAVRGIATEKWQNIYDATKNSNYYPQNSSGQWLVTSGAENVTVGNHSFTRSFIIQNVCRDNTSRDITDITDSSGTSTACTGTAADDSHDPSSQKISSTISWSGADPITSAEYVLRWRNKLCEQTNWATSGSSGVKSCPDTTYESSTNITPGTEIEICSGGC